VVSVAAPAWRSLAYQFNSDNGPFLVELPAEGAKRAIFPQFASFSLPGIMLGCRVSPVRAGSGVFDMAGASAQPRRRFQLVLIKPSHYDDDGYVI
jgi:hypothetical protein